MRKHGIRLGAAALGLVLALILAVGPAQAADKTLMMATTTSTDNTGLLDYLAPKFQEDTGIELKWSSMGTGKALQFGRDCNADILLVHAPEAEKEYVEEGSGVDRREVMYNDFVIIGPPSDPAGVKGMDVKEALSTIAEKSVVFVSRGDESGTNKKEQSLWTAAGMELPDKQDWYVQTGQGMLKTILVASDRDGYTMTDRGTFIKYEAENNGEPPLVIIVEGDETLFNQYSVITVNPEKCPSVKTDLARTFSDWITSEKTQKVIAEFLLLDKQLFTPNAK
ncbi:tungsten ABC transporter substrate-binding protein [Oceanidesulfovibrio indonesiensis]|uniref:Tungsten ABC transporter substrate-binding protein n=1 Tax=Oceanidesulfovibrio indonesiensis TaxID=54767 RepID=A0A7M3MF34_9BACT|nr:substrate-binding domain-containing protein [Oceanidesulfovibrio indonesiensis]TVM17626.1 tungsten ABC transporter substrate-binding protein [Oceanidesulfovibrio indonesiensis]